MTDSVFGVPVVLYHTQPDFRGTNMHTTAHADFGEKTACGITILPYREFDRLGTDEECDVDCGRCLRILDAGKRPPQAKLG